MDYAVVHSGRRTIAIQIQRDGRVVVRAPYAATAEDIRRVVDSHRDWVEKTVRRQQEQLAAQADQYRFGKLHHPGEIRQGQRQAQPEHDDAQRSGKEKRQQGIGGHYCYRSS